MPQPPAGFSLIEVLVALVVMAVGLLGGVTMVIEGLRTSRTALEQTQAATLAADLGERIRTNRAAGPTYSLEAGTELAAPEATCATIDECGPTEVAERDLYEWQQAVLAALPGAVTEVGVVQEATAETHTYSITIRWAQPGAADSATIRLTVLA